MKKQDRIRKLSNETSYTNIELSHGKCQVCENNFLNDIRISGVNSCHQNGRAEKRIKDLQVKYRVLRLYTIKSMARRNRLREFNCNFKYHKRIKSNFEYHKQIFSHLEEP